MANRKARTATLARGQGDWARGHFPLVAQTVEDRKGPAGTANPPAILADRLVPDYTAQRVRDSGADLPAPDGPSDVAIEGPATTPARTRSHCPGHSRRPWRRAYEAGAHGRGGPKGPPARFGDSQSARPALRARPRPVPRSGRGRLGD